MTQAPIRPLDGLRAVAVMLVLLLHFGYLNGGWIGVQLFFVLSGFLITGVLLADRDAPLGAYLRRFYWRRTLRIFPLYYGYLAVLAVAYAAWEVPAGFSDNAPALFTYTYNFTRGSDFHPSPFFTHFWSLAVEEQFYLVWPFLVHALSRRALVGLSAALVALLRVADRVARPGLVAAMAVTGVAAAGLVNLRALRGAGADLPLGTMGFPLASVDHGAHVWGYTVLNLAAAALVAAAVGAHRGGGIVSGLGWGPLAGLGKISYGVYVLHWPLLVLFNASVRYRPMTVRGALMCAGWSALVCGVAWLSWRFYESPLLALKSRGWGREIRPRPGEGGPGP